MVGAHVSTLRAPAPRRAGTVGHDFGGHDGVMTAEPKRPRIVVVGSLNHDIAVRLPRFPAVDETLIAHDLTEFRGGKGYNQATAISRLGAAATMVGCLGNDGAGELLRDGLRHSGIDDRFVTVVGAHTGTALPLITDRGEVSIVIVPGANAALTPALVDAAAEAFTDAAALLLQGEVPVAASLRAAELARGVGARVVVNPAPVGPGCGELVDAADLVVVNRVEAETLGLSPSWRVVVTLGADGVIAGDTRVPAFRADVVDPTGAGDAFCAALTYALTMGHDLASAVRFGAAAGACAVQRLGAEPGLPTLDEVKAMLATA